MTTLAHIIAAVKLTIRSDIETGTPVRFVRPVQLPRCGVPIAIPAGTPGRVAGFSPGTTNVETPAFGLLFVPDEGDLEPIPIADLAWWASQNREHHTTERTPLEILAAQADPDDEPTDRDYDVLFAELYGTDPDPWNEVRGSFIGHPAQ